MRLKKHHSQQALPPWCNADRKWNSGIHDLRIEHVSTQRWRLSRAWEAAFTFSLRIRPGSKRPHPEVRGVHQANADPAERLDPETWSGHCVTLPTLGVRLQRSGPLNCPNTTITDPGPSGGVLQTSSSPEAFDDGRSSPHATSGGRWTRSKTTSAESPRREPPPPPNMPDGRMYPPRDDFVVRRQPMGASSARTTGHTNRNRQGRKHQYYQPETRGHRI